MNWRRRKKASNRGDDKSTGEESKRRIKPLKRITIFIILGTKFWTFTVLLYSNSVIRVVGGR